jgi:hypothetical protein
MAFFLLRGCIQKLDAIFNPYPAIIRRGGKPDWRDKNVRADRFMHAGRPSLFLTV